jgi:predicted ATPase
LEQAAPPSEILLGPDTYRLVRSFVEAEPLEPLRLKGKAEPVPAYRLGAPSTAAAFTAEQVAIVGREEELAALSAAFDECVARSACMVATVLGEPGVGKTRLVEEFGRRIADTDGNARMIEGRCLSYGRGITFWPLIEIVTQAARITDDDPTEEARSKLLSLAAGDELVAQRVASVVGLSDDQLPVEETFWGVRKLLETMASERPLAVVFQDLHWAEPTLLDLIEHLKETVAGPLMVICPARPELLASRPEFEERTEASRVQLEPLSEDEVETMIRELLGAALSEATCATVNEAAGGNPLFVEQLVSMLVDEGMLLHEKGEWVPREELDELEVPPTLQALLAARLDQLQREERAVIEPASVIGAIFPIRALGELVEDTVRPQLGLRISSLTIKQLIQEEFAHAIAGETYRFGHVHIREAAYHRLLKRDRAELHERFVDWGERESRERGREIEFEEIIAYHLEQAYTYLTELGPLDRHGRELGERAAARLIASGRRALMRGDMPAAANLLQRAAAVLPLSDPVRLEVLPELAEALMDIGEFDGAGPYLDEAVEAAIEHGDVRLRARARLVRLQLESQAGESQDWADQVVAEAQTAIPIFQAADDHANLAMAWRLLAWAYGTRCSYAEATSAAERAVEEARAAGDSRQRRRAASQYAVASLYGPMPVDQAIARCEAIIEEATGDRRTVGLVTSLLARLEAMRGDFDRARRLYVSARLMLEEMGRSVVACSTALDSCGVEMLAGDPEAAERELRRDYQALTQMGERYLLSTLASELARAVYAQGRYEEAFELTRTAEDLSAADDITSQALWRMVRGKVLARRGEAERAAAVASEAVELMRQTDASVVRDEGLVDVAEAMRLAGQSAAAREYLEEALGLFERKGNLVSAAAARESLDALAPASAGYTS